MKFTHDLTNPVQDELHRPAFPYKFMFKMAGCANDCVASVARADMSIIGTWADNIQIDAKEVTAYAKAGKVSFQEDIVDLCPTGCIKWDGKAIAIDNSNCVKCMHCINVLPKALAPGKERGATILLGAKAPIIGGALLSSVLVPFVEMDDPEDIYELAEEIWDLWGEHGMNRERVGEFIQRIGLGNFLEQIGLEPEPEMVIHPRTNPYIFFELDEEE